MSTHFSYEARGPSGRIERGSLAAPDRQAALQRLHRRRLTPLSLKASATGAKAAPRLSDKGARDLARALAQLLQSGLSFGQALRFASEELGAEPGMVAARMREAAESGAPASSALDDFSGAQARLLKGVVVAGETSGKLADALEIAAIAFGRAADLRARMGSALIYPSFVIVATLATLACFLLFVVPTLAQAFVGVEDRLPGSTQALLGLSAWLQANGLVLLVTTIALATLLTASADLRRLATAAADQILVSPLALGVATRLEFSAFSALAALSLHAGVPTSAAFEAAAAGVRNQAIKAGLDQVNAAIRTGERPSAALERLAAPPKSFLRLIHVGEETGRLADALRNAAALLSSEAEQRLERLGAIAGPIVTLSLGGLVAGIVVSLFLGLLALSDLAGAQ